MAGRLDSPIHRLDKHSTPLILLPMKSPQDRALTAGCFITFAAFVGAIVWVIIDGRQHLIWVSVALIAGSLLLKYSQKRFQQRIQALLDTAFASKGLSSPTFTFHAPASKEPHATYRLSFPTAEAEQTAWQSGAVDAFQTSLLEHHRTLAPEKLRADFKVIIDTTHPGKPTAAAP